MDQQNKFELEHPLKFTYPILGRLILGIGGLAFLTVAVFTSPLVRGQGLAIWVPLFFLVTGLGSVLVLYFLSGHYVIDSYAVSFHRFSKEIIIPFSDVQRIEHRDASDRLVIHGLKGKIIVEKQLIDYLLFYSLLNKFCPSKEHKRTVPFPLEIHNRLWVPIFSVVIVLIGLGNLAYAIYYAYIPQGVLGVLGVIIGVFFFLAIPRSYIFDAFELTVISPIRQKIYKTEDLLHFKLIQESNQYTYGMKYSLLKLNYKNGKVTLRDLAVDFPLEVLEKILHERYPKYYSSFGSYPDDAGTVRRWLRSFGVNKNPRLNRAALVIAAVVFLGVSTLLLLPKDESLFIAFTSNLSTVEHYPNPGPRYILSSGLHAAFDPLHEWNRTSYGLIWHWHVTDVAGDDPLEYYREIDLTVVAIYAIIALGSAVVSWLATFIMVRLWKRRNSKLEFQHID